MANINQNLFKPWVTKAIPMSLISGVPDGYFSSDNSGNEEVYSEYSASPAKCRNIVVSAMCKILSIVYGSKDGKTNDAGSLGIINMEKKQGLGIEIVQGGHREAAMIKPNTDGVPTVYARTDTGMYSFKEGYNNGVLLMAAVIFSEIMKISSKNSNYEFTKCFQTIRDCWKEGLNDGNKAKFVNYMSVLSENIFRRLCGNKDRIETNPLNNNGNVNQLTDFMLNSGRFTAELKYGSKFLIIPSLDSDIEVNNDEIAEGPKPANKWLKREWAEDEKKLIPKIPEWYIMPKEVTNVCNLIKASTNTFKPKRNFMFRGPSSTGKTSMARAIAAKLGMPYMFITCSSDTESSAFLGEPMYDKNGNVKYVESPFIKAIKNGYVIEIQEPYVIAKQGVLTSLNGLLDDSAGVTLATGEFVVRHPDCVVIFTTNVSYVGCKKPNQSVLRRMNGVYDINMPPEAEVCKRIKANTKFNDKALLIRMVRCAHKIDKYLQEQMIDDGVCGVSEIIDWVSTVQIQGDIVEAASSTIVSKATDDPLEQSNILAIVEAEFANTVYQPDEYVNDAMAM